MTTNDTSTNTQDVLKVINWANSHDWCVSCDVDSAGIITVSTRNEGVLTFKTLSKMRMWAGY